jgi:transcriptional regulator with GAF, ATPase, and Fis domain
MEHPRDPFAFIVGELDRLIGTTATAVASLCPETLETALVDALRQVGETLEADWATFETLSAPRDGQTLRRAWCRPGAAVSGTAGLTIPVAISGGSYHVLSVARHGRDPWPAAVAERLLPVSNLLGLAVNRCRESQELTRVKSQLADAAASAVPIFDDAGDVDFEDIIGESPALRAALSRVQDVAPTDASVVIVGETGTGKELFARAIHNRSARRARRFVGVNCAALPSTLIESELFGHERGAFTGAVAMREGRFEIAHRGTLFLDEIGDLPPEVQAKLLRVLQEGEFERVGSSHSRKVDVRVIAATHQDLELAVKEGRFRADLYYRLSVYPIALPPLRERLEDLPRLVWYFINRRQRTLNRKFTSVPEAVFTALARHYWPGNVRELYNVVERAMIHSRGATLSLDDEQRLPATFPVRAAGFSTLEEVERHHLEAALQKCRWRINGRGNAAEILGLHPNTLRFRMKKLGIQRPHTSVVRLSSRQSA